MCGEGVRRMEGEGGGGGGGGLQPIAVPESAISHST